MPRLLLVLLLVALLSACSQTGTDTSGVPDLPETTADAFEARLAALDRPAVVNVWALVAAAWAVSRLSFRPLLRSGVGLAIAGMI